MHARVIPVEHVRAVVFYILRAMHSLFGLFVRITVLLVVIARWQLTVRDVEPVVFQLPAVPVYVVVATVRTIKAGVRGSGHDQTRSHDRSGNQSFHVSAESTAILAVCSDS